MNNRTAGILTFHQANNYGAALQAFALKAYCETLGYETHIIDYRALGDADKVTPFKDFFAADNKKRAFFKLFRSLMSVVGDRKRADSFLRFREKYLAESIPCYSVDDVKHLNYDVYIAGSDQIWNYQITSMEFNPVFFLQFHTEAKRIIYGASSQDTPFPLDWELKFRYMLEKTDAVVGIREKKLADYVYEVCGKNYPVVADPTILAGKDILDQIPTGESVHPPYILIYQIDANPYSDVSVKTLEKRFQCPVYTMTVPRLGSIHGRKGQAGPEEFLGFLKNARFLVTNSFHGVALSLLYEKQFFVYENGGVMSRIDGLLKQTGLLDRKIKMVRDIDPQHRIDYRRVTPVIEELQKSSCTFLHEALQGRQILEAVSGLQEEEKDISVKNRKKENCCGCSACADICPVHAIEMKPDQEGFLYPKIDTEKCINCKLCDRVCSFERVKKRPEPFELPLAYGVKHKILEERESSRSGAAFIGISDLVLKNGGVVYGAVMQKDFSVKHMRAENTDQRNQMKKAKYVQSTMLDVCGNIEQDLRDGREVLFSGTPCQVAGVKSFLRIRKVPDEKFYCCDLVCHGVPSPLIWKKYIQFIEQKYHGQIIEANFRDKEFGWDSHCESFVVKGRKKKVVSRDYTDLFYDHIMFRPSCHTCPFANVYRPGDISLADFWGIEKHDRSFDDNRGVSLVLVNSPAGKKLFDRASSQFEYFACDVQDCLQPTLIRPSIPSPRRQQFWTDLQQMPFDRLMKKYTIPVSLQGKIKKRLKNLLYRTGIRKHP